MNVKAPNVSVPPPKYNIKRVKLLVRRPPPPITNPLQRPPPVKHNSSLREFLSSYITLHDKDVNEKTLLRHATTDASVYERTEAFRKQGRFIPGTDLLFGFNVDTETAYVSPRRKTKDQWDYVIEAIIEQKKMKSRPQSGPEITSQIASKIRSYWDGQEAKKDKLRLQEERRLRTLAKATIKLITSEWKKAVFVRLLIESLQDTINTNSFCSTLGNKND